MIGRLNGIVDTIDEDWAIIDVGGVGYQLSCSGRTLRGLGAVGETTRVHVETFIRDDRIVLYGFADQAERGCFRLLMTVQGVGARTALAILSVLTPDELTQAVVAQDKAAVSRANGVGARVAQRVVTELKDRMGDIGLGPGAALQADAGGATVDGADDADAVSALVNLGYGRSEAYGAVVAARRVLGDGADASGLIRAGLKELAQ
ncbi:MAG: Holliday junction branch migration protein RuvA [Rhodospirillaceae bacterium]|nr:Holliday junction branch migration protein RuvA [Rhodospirillaceae bacterium]|tara:strand:+ start:1729 stop:2343 length:615 start_codon:yes stop_codon:yes gene_type:complete